MAKLIDDTLMLDRIADAVVSGSAKHVTGAIRALGIPRGHHDERRLLKKWVAGGELLLSKARERSAYKRGYDEGFARAVAPWGSYMIAANVVGGGEEPQPSWFARTRLGRWLARA